MKAFLVAVKSAQVRKAAHLEVVRVEGALSSFLKHLKYLPTDPKKVDRFVKITVASLTEFIRVHRDGLKKLYPELYKKKGSSRDANVSYLNDIIIEGKMEVEGGWTTCVPRLPPSSTSTAPLAIADQPTVS